MTHLFRFVGIVSDTRDTPPFLVVEVNLDKNFFKNGLMRHWVRF